MVYWFVLNDERIGMKKKQHIDRRRKSESKNELGCVCMSAENNFFSSVFCLLFFSMGLFFYSFTHLFNFCDRKKKKKRIKNGIMPILPCVSAMLFVPKWWINLYFFFLSLVIASIRQEQQKKGVEWMRARVQNSVLVFWIFFFSSTLFLSNFYKL